MKTFDVQERASRLYNVAEERVTPTMVAGLRVTRIELAPADYRESERRAAGLPVWMACPRCGHSATGKYANHHACTRCDWVEGQA